MKEAESELNAGENGINEWEVSLINCPKKPRERIKEWKQWEKRDMGRDLGELIWQNRNTFRRGYNRWREVTIEEIVKENNF